MIGVKIDKSWSFSNITRKDTSYITHGYHRYPAKFIPQVVSRLLNKYSHVGNTVVDPFGGCGTTLVESKVNGRRSIGVDINPVAVLITKAKITPINPEKLFNEVKIIIQDLSVYNSKLKIDLPTHTRIDYWFKPDQKKKLAFILQLIVAVKDEDVRNFFLCAFSNILKNCSIWLQKSNKPTRDLDKKPSDPITFFTKQIKHMVISNNEYYELLKNKDYLKIESKIVCADARKVPIKDGYADLIITSPPYVTSYEYADLHQLTVLWLKYASDLVGFRQKFIGTSYHMSRSLNLNSMLAERIKFTMLQKNKKISDEVSTYFTDMNEVFIESKRILKKKGTICIVIGNTKIKGVEILNAEVFVEQLTNLGFKILKIIKREIPSKNLPSTRDKITGRFASIKSENKISAYPTEYIIIAER